jgi:hypothetical protein
VNVNIGNNKLTMLIFNNLILMTIRQLMCSNGIERGFDCSTVFLLGFRKVESLIITGRWWWIGDWDLRC